jgi:hypothetical protein
VIGINPYLAGQIHGAPFYKTLAEVPDVIDMVDIFRKSEAAAEAVDEALALQPKPKVIWMKLGVRLRRQCVKRKMHFEAQGHRRAGHTCIFRVCVGAHTLAQSNGSIKARAGLALPELVAALLRKKPLPREHRTSRDWPVYRQEWAAGLTQKAPGRVVKTRPGAHVCEDCNHTIAGRP